MKSLLLLTSILLMNSGLHAQNIRLSQKYTTQTIPGAEFHSYLINDYYYVIHDKYNMKSRINRDVQMDVFDNKGEFVSSTGIIDADMNPAGPNMYIGIYPLKEKMVMFKADYKKEGEKKFYRLYYYTFSNLTHEDNGTLLSSIDADGMSNSGKYEIATSPDGSKVALISQQPYIKGMKEKIKVTVFDDSFKQLWTLDYEFPFDNVKYPTNEVSINNSGNIFILKNVDNKTEDPYQSLLSLTNNGNKVKQNRIAMGENNKIAYYKTLFNLQGDLILSGFYVTSKKSGFNLEKPRGTFYMKAGAADGVVSVTAFTPGTFTMSTKLISVNLLENDQVALTSEEQLVNSTPIPGQAFEYTYKYENGIIHLIKLNNQGKQEWDYPVKHDISSTDDGGKANSVFTGIKNGNVCLIYPDKFYKYDGGAQGIILGARASRQIDAMQVIDKEGKMISDTYIKRLGDSDSKEIVFIYLIPVTGKQQDESSVFFMGCSRDILYGVKITF